jgi:apolipoprotein D and lipocalin family protein
MRSNTRKKVSNSASLALYLIASLRKMVVAARPNGLKIKVMKKKLLATLLGLSALSAFTHPAFAQQGTQATTSVLQTIPALDVNRYMGTWFEIAKYPNWFQKKCLGGAKADYSLIGDGQVQVLNRCLIEGGQWSEALGVAKQVGPATSPQLKVRFAPAWLSFLPFVWGNYWVIDLDEDYQLVAVSEPQKEYLWILSRTPKVDPVRYRLLLTRLQQKGFDLDKLEMTQHN